MLEARASSEQQSADVDIEDLTVSLVRSIQRQVGEFAKTVEDACIADENVQLAERCNRLFNCLAIRRRFAQIGRDGNYPVAERLPERGQSDAVGIDHSDAAAFAHKALDDSPADAAGAAGNQGDLVG